MQAIDRIPGLRERKKIRTRETIRREAFRLIEEHGYAATTVEQIAEAAEVSPSTFFRYFPTKESVLLADDMDPLILDALEEQPADLSPSQAVRRAYQADHGQPVGGPAGVREHPATADVLDTRNSRRRCTTSITAPSPRSPRRVGRRIGRDAGDFELRVFAGALAGAMMAVYEPGPDATDTVLSRPGLRRRRHAADLSERARLTRCQSNGVGEGSCAPARQRDCSCSRLPRPARRTNRRPYRHRWRRTGDHHARFRRDDHPRAAQAGSQRRLHRAGRSAGARSRADRGDQLVRRPAVRGVAVGPTQTGQCQTRCAEPGQRNSGSADRRPETRLDRRHRRRTSTRTPTRSCPRSPRRFRSPTATHSSSRGRTRRRPSARRFSSPTR